MNGVRELDDGGLTLERSTVMAMRYSLLRTTEGYV
jgi:hypothetical protein